MLSLNNVVWPENIDFSSTATTLKNQMPGVYQMQKSDVVSIDSSTLPLLDKAAFLEHLENMKNQLINLDMDESTFRKLVSREHLQKQSCFIYNENLVFSVLDLVATSTPGFPQKWNFDKIPGPLKSLCSVSHFFCGKTYMRFLPSV